MTDAGLYRESEDVVKREKALDLAYHIGYQTALLDMLPKLESMIGDIQETVKLDRINYPNPTTPSRSAPRPTPGNPFSWSRYYRGEISMPKPPNGELHVRLSQPDEIDPEAHLASEANAPEEAESLVEACLPGCPYTEDKKQCDRPGRCRCYPDHY